MALLPEATALPTGRSEAPVLPVLVYTIDDPVNPRVLADGRVRRVDKDDLVVFVGCILIDPVRVEDAEIHAPTANTLLGNALQAADSLEVVDSVVLGLSVYNALAVGPLAVAAANCDAVNHKTLCQS